MQMFPNLFDSSSHHFFNYIFVFLLLIVYFRITVNKLKKLGGYYLSFKEYASGTNAAISSINPLLLLSIELIVIPMILIPYTMIAGSLVVVITQIFYLILIMNSKKNVTDVNCGCYITLPRKVDFWAIFKNVFILFIGLMNIGLLLM